MWNGSPWFAGICVQWRCISESSDLDNAATLRPARPPTCAMQQRRAHTPPAQLTCTQRAMRASSSRTTGSRLRPGRNAPLAVGSRSRRNRREAVGRGRTGSVVAGAQERSVLGAGNRQALRQTSHTWATEAAPQAAAALQKKLQLLPVGVTAPFRVPQKAARLHTALWYPPFPSWDLLLFNGTTCWCAPCCG